MLHLYELVLISHAIRIADSVPLPSGNCFVFRTPQRIGILFRNGIEDPSELLFCVFLPENIYQFQCLCVSGWRAVSPAGHSSHRDARILVTQQVLSIFAASLHSFHPNEI